MNTTQKLTAAQTIAARKLIAGETIHAYNGTTIATARALIALGAAQWAFKPWVSTTFSKVSGCSKNETQWAIKASDELVSQTAERRG